MTKSSFTPYRAFRLRRPLAFVRRHTPFPLIPSSVLRAGASAPPECKRKLNTSRNRKNPFGVFSFGLHLPIYGPRHPRPRPDFELLRPRTSRETLPPRGAERAQKGDGHFHIGLFCRSILSKNFSTRKKRAFPLILGAKRAWYPLCV